MPTFWKLIQYLRQWNAFVRTLILVPLILGGVIAANRASLFRSLEWNMTDYFYDSHPLTGTDHIFDRFAIVTIDEADISFVQQWPMTDRVMVQMFSNILAQNPRVVGMDIYRDLPVEPGNEDLHRLFAAYPNIVGVEKVTEPTIAPPPVLAEKGQVASSEFLFDADGKVRRGVFQIEAPEGRIADSLSTYVARFYLAQDGIELQTLTTRNRPQYQLGQATFSPLRKAPPEEGHQLIINYLGKLENFPEIALRDVLQNKIEPGFFSDRIVLIGSKAPSLNDNHRTPLNTGILENQVPMPGIIIHANMAAQIMSAALYDRPLLQVVSPTVNYLWIFIFTLYGAIAGTLYVSHRWVTWGILLLGIFIILEAAYVAFLNGWIILTFTPLVALGISSIASMLTSLWHNLNESYKTLEEKNLLLEDANQQLQHLNQKYSYFVPFEYLQFLDLPSILDLKLGDHVSCNMAIMFSDIRNFTSLSEAMTPQRTFDFVNTYLQKVGPEIRNHGGIIIKFMGDSIMSIFPDNADECLEAAIATQKRLAELNVELTNDGLSPLQIGIGIHVGNAMLGIIGEKSRMQGDVLSDAVNLASRLEGLTKRYGCSILISENTFRNLKNSDRYSTRFLDQVVVKGRTEPIYLYEVIDGEPPELYRLKQETHNLFDQGLLAYFQNDFTTAEQFFTQVLEVNPSDKTSQLYLDRISYFKAYGVPANWHGVWHFQEK